MALTEYQQIHGFLGNSKNVLIVAGHKELEDSYPASLSLAKVLIKNGKEITLFCKDAAPERLGFLDEYFGNKIEITNSVNSSRDLIVSINTSQKPVKSISYKRSDNWLNINITPEPNASIEEKDVHIKLSNFGYDLIVTLGLEDLESAGQEFENNASLFFETPIINIDRSSSNERYGEINVVEPLASSCSEILTSILKEWDEDIIDKGASTLLLAGIISTTRNFQNIRTKPNTLLTAGYLMSREAQQQEIIRYLFKTKPFEFLKLLGIAMTKFQYDEAKNLGWVKFSQNDFNESGSTPKSIPSIIMELKNNFSGSLCLVVLWEGAQNYFGIINSESQDQLKPIEGLFKFEKRGNNLLFTVPKDSYDQNEIVSKVSSLLS